MAYKGCMTWEVGLEGVMDRGGILSLVGVIGALAEHEGLSWLHDYKAFWAVLQHGVWRFAMK
jgi:hypothetical protein